MDILSRFLVSYVCHQGTQMGMFDYVRSSYMFSTKFNSNTVFQTKDINYDIGGTLTTYYIDPCGAIWKPDYTGTNDLVFLDENHPEYNEKSPFFNYKWVPTGKRGRYRPFDITDYVTIYPEHTHYELNSITRTSIKIHFVNGILKTWQYQIHHKF